MEPKQRILNCLRKADKPMGVESIRVACKIGNWNTALKHCLELLIQGKIKGQKTSKAGFSGQKRGDNKDG